MQAQAKPFIRLFVDMPLASGAQFPLNVPQSHYLAHVMRLKEGDSLAVFNGQDGEWLAEIDTLHKKTITLRLINRRKMQPPVGQLYLAFAPIKNKTELLVEKAVELGVASIATVVTHHSVVRSVNAEKLSAHAIEAAEQCERLDVPHMAHFSDLARFLGDWPQERLLLYGDETGGGVALKQLLPALPGKNIGILIGPEGGFSAAEHHMLKLQPFIRAVSLGSRILRADTAAVALLACVQAWCGDWAQNRESIP